jgi:hypothetical protein
MRLPAARRWVEQADAAYAQFLPGWNPRKPKARTGAAKEERGYRLRGWTCISRPALCRTVARAPREDSAVRRKRLLSITSVIGGLLVLVQESMRRPAGRVRIRDTVCRNNNCRVC